MKTFDITGKLFLAIMLIAAAFIPSGFAQTITTNRTAAQLANALTGPGVTVTNPTLNCPGSANGSYTGGTGVLGIGNGILLTTGSASAVSNPGSYFESTANNTPGDADLTSLITGLNTFDACVLEFDFVPSGDSIAFRYQFASEEYPQYTCTQFNDVFGFFISGPGYVGKKNIALVPNTNIPVAINSVNGGSATGLGTIATCNAMGTGSPFSAYFINHASSSANPAYDGFTTVLVAKAAVQPCSTYHFKLGVADASDPVLSSGVFLQESSLTVLPPVILNCPSNITTTTGPAATLCGTTATWTPPTTKSCLNTTVSSTHNPGAFFPVGTTAVTYTFTNAGGSSTCTFNVTVSDNTPPIAMCQPVTVTLSGGAASITPAMVDNGSTDNCGAVTLLSVTPNTFDCDDAGATIPVVLNIRDAAGNTSSCSTTVTIDGIVPTCATAVTPANSVYTGGVATNIYLGYGPQSATITANATGGTFFTYSWAGPTAYLSCTGCQSPVFTPTTGGSYTYTVTITNEFGCSSSCDVTFCVKDIRVPNKPNKVYVCHYAPNPTNTLAINVNAVAAHLAANPNDYLGMCGQTCDNIIASRMPMGNGFIPSEEFAVKVYPNPFTDELRIMIESTSFDRADITISDLTGRKLSQLNDQKTNSELHIGGTLASGTYYLEVKSGNETRKIQVVKTH
jgi:hypothetical protein